MSTTVVSLELNELKFDYVAKYSQLGYLPNFGRCLREFGVYQTQLERCYEHLEPWIQWPSVYTGKMYGDHQLFRLVDCVKNPQAQIWDTLEAEKNARVAAISPMNAANLCDNPAFFLPDPWTETEIVGTRLSKKLFLAIRQIVNDNAHSGGKIKSLFWLAIGGLRFGRAASIKEYAKALQLVAKGQKWAKVLILDRLLADMMLTLMKKSRLDYCSLFLNAGAHIQHHHMFDCSVYEGEHNNPEWYSSALRKNIDPLLDVYRLYDRILGEFISLQNVRLFVTTALSQVPNGKQVFQYRLKDHTAFLTAAGLKNFKAVPRMSRDFSILLNSPADTPAVAERLERYSIDGKPIISVDDRGSGDLFCKIVYFGPMEAWAGVTVDGRQVDMSDDVALVSIENAVHQTIGYHIDAGEISASGTRKDMEATVSNLPKIPLTNVFDRLYSAV